VNDWQDIFEVLKRSAMGKTALSAYQKDGKFNKDSSRDAVVSCLLENEIADDTKISILINSENNFLILHCICHDDHVIEIKSRQSDSRDVNIFFLFPVFLGRG